MSGSTRRIELTLRVSAAPPPVARHQPDPGGTHPRARTAHPLCARRARAGGQACRPSLQPFQPLLFSWAGRGEAPALTGAERAEPAAAALPAPCLLQRVLPERAAAEAHHPARSAAAAVRLSITRPSPACAPVRSSPRCACSRSACWRVLGYGLELATEAHSGEPVAPHRLLRVPQPPRGWCRPSAAMPGRWPALAHRLAAERFSGARTLEDARHLLKAALAACLEGRPLATRAWRARWCAGRPP